MNLRCVRCKKTPEELEEYRDMAECEGYKGPTGPSDFVLENEGTLNAKTGLFACTGCYIAMGTPSSPQGWTP